MFIIPSTANKLDGNVIVRPSIRSSVRHAFLAEKDIFINI